MKAKKVNFVATQYKNQNIKLHFFTKDGNQIPADCVKRTSNKEKVEFIADRQKTCGNFQMSSV